MTMEDLQKAAAFIYTATMIYRGRNEDGKTTSGRVIEKSGPRSGEVAGRAIALSNRRPYVRLVGDYKCTANQGPSKDHPARLPVLNCLQSRVCANPSYIALIPIIFAASSMLPLHPPMLAAHLTAQKELSTFRRNAGSWALVINIAQDLFGCCLDKTRRGLLSIPNNCLIIYAVNEIQPAGNLQSFSVGDAGLLSLVDTVSTGGNGPTFTNPLSTREVTGMTDSPIIDFPVGPDAPPKPHISLEHSEKVFVSDWAQTISGKSTSKAPPSRGAPAAKVLISTPTECYPLPPMYTSKRNSAGDTILIFERAVLRFARSISVQRAEALGVWYQDHAPGTPVVNIWDSHAN
ncbi:hypothetical protein EDD85DRAFT_792017 [Armillaria nabsnona]|nr:hypothetical protein EDD85DRAFT_792017 [Armillaria nabsnona]